MMFVKRPIGCEQFRYGAITTLPRDRHRASHCRMADREQRYQVKDVAEVLIFGQLTLITYPSDHRCCWTLEEVCETPLQDIWRVALDIDPIEIKFVGKSLWPLLETATRAEIKHPDSAVRSARIGKSGQVAARQEVVFP
jgi:hypothetical protein